MNRILVAVLVFVLTAPSAAHSAPIKNGANCTKAGEIRKVGTNGARFICIKSGKKMVWKQKTASNNSAKSTKLLPSPTPIAAATKVIPLEVLYGQELLDQLVTRASTSPLFSNYELEVEPILKGTFWELTQTEGIARSFTYLNALGVVPTSKIHIFVSWNDYWLQERLISASSTCAGNSSFSGGEFCAGQNPSIYANAGWHARQWGLPVSAKAVPSNFLIGLVGNMPHEIAHAGQIRGYEKNGTQNWRFVPAWLREGWADLFKVFYFADSRNLSFADAHKLFVEQSSLRCLDYSIRDLSGNGSHPEQSYCEYTNGYFATLKLLQTVKDVDLLFRLAGATGTSQEETFKATFNLDYEEFIKQADNFTRQALNDKSWW